MSRYVIGDLQGCYASLQRLLAHICFDPQTDFLYFAGDLVARGEDSLACLRQVKTFCEAGCAATVLGNHDLTLIAGWRGLTRIKARDKTQPILDAPDAGELLDWLCQQPLFMMLDEQHVLCHAGLPPDWTVSQALSRSQEVQAVLADPARRDAFLQAMYGSQPDQFQDSLQGNERLRAITNTLTRLRLCTAQGRMEFEFKGELDEPDMPADFDGWFRWPPLQPRQHAVIFGHWAALEARIHTPLAIATDGACVWGGQLVAYRLSDGQRLAVDCAGCT